MRSLTLFTNRNMIVFDDKGEQDAEAQSSVSCYDIDAARAQSAVDSCTEFYLAKWREWRHSVTKREIEYLLGLRTKERDLGEA